MSTKEQPPVTLWMPVDDELYEALLDLVDEDEAEPEEQATQ